MAKLHFYYSTMNAGKSTTLLQSDYNYRERGMNTLLFTSSFDNLFGIGNISSRIGLQASAFIYHQKTDLCAKTKTMLKSKKLHCVLVDEAQFLKKLQVLQLTAIVDELNIPVLAYGLRNDFQAEPFEGSKYLLTWADELIEIKTICHCGKKATHVLRLNENMQVIKSGEQLHIGGNERYLSVCRWHFKQGQAT